MAAPGVGEQGRASALALAAGWLSRPACVVAVVVLLLNDHVLKAAYGSWWTGKLSDVAGLVFAPALVAVAVGAVTPRLSPERVRQVSVGLVALVFTLVKVTVWGAEAASAAWTAVAGPSVVLRDATDLVALPALALSWWSASSVRGGRTARSRTSLEGAAPGRVRGWRTTMTTVLRWGVVLPVAVLATAATSSAETRQVRGVAVVGESIVVEEGWVEGNRANERTDAWYVSSDGTSWTLLPEGDDGQPAPAYQHATQRTACVPPDEQTCFAAVAGRLAVQRSDDGGDTWEIDWEVPDDVRDAHAGRTYSDPGHLRTYSVAVLPTTDGYVVYAANGTDGLAVRDEAGVWRRVPFEPGGDGSRPVPLPERVPVPDVVPGGWLIGVGVGAIALAALAALRGRGALRAPAGIARRVTRVVVVAVNVVVSAMLLRQAAELNFPAAEFRQPGVLEVLSARGAITFLLVSVVLLALVAVAVAGLDVKADLAAAIAVGTLAGLVYSVVPGTLGGVAVGVVAVSGVVVLARRRRRTDRGGRAGDTEGGVPTGAPAPPAAGEPARLV